MDQGSTPLAYTPTHLADKILTARAALEGERKQVTVLFADIKDSTELITDLDPEAAQQFLDPTIHHMMDAVHRFEGTVNQVLGDGIMALFGAPIAHEVHALRACYAALAMQAAVRNYAEEIRRSHGMTMRIRVGLNSGEVVVRTIGNDLHMDYSAVGQTTHLASRMEQLAAPGGITLTATTLRLVEGLVRATALGPVPVKGMPEPVEVFELTGASGVRRRLQATVARGLTRFVGRETEMAALIRALERAGAGHGQVVAVVGEAGVGKSRLLYEFIHSHRTQGWLVLESASVSYGKATPYFPVVDLLKRYVHVDDGDAPRTIRAKVTGQVLTLDETLQEMIPALLSLLDALLGDSPFLHLEPPQRRQRTLEALTRLLLRESQVQPLLLVFEDLHWIDAETQALLESLVESLPTARLLLLVNYRPEYQHGWGSKTYYTQLRLDPLAPASTEELLRALLGDDPRLEPLKTLVIERTEGNPFFLEESVRTLVETRVLVGAPGAYRLTQDLPTIQVPPTVQAVLAARLDRLPAEEKRLLQTAAVIGMEVPFPLLQAMVTLPAAALSRGLMHLQGAEFLYQTSLYPEQVYTFKHALTHEVAYGSLLQERRRVLHARIVEALETLVGDRVHEQVERLAHHAFRGAAWYKAFSYFRQAGSRAAGRSANREAVACFEHALEALSRLPETRERREQAIDLRFELRSALIQLGELGGILNHLREAETLAKALDDQQRLGRTYSHMAHYCWLVCNYQEALEHGQHALAIAEASDDVALQAEVRMNALGQVYFFIGDYRRAMDCFTQTMAFFASALHDADEHAALFISSVRARVWMARCLGELGGFVEGIAYGNEAVHIAQEADHLNSILFAHYVLGSLALHKGDLDQALPRLERALARCRDAQMTYWPPAIASTLGSAYALVGRIDEALPLLEQAVAQSGKISSSLIFIIRLGEAYLIAKRVEDAMQLAERALGSARDHKQRGYEAYALHLLGAIATHRHPPVVEQAETHYRQALALADDLGMRPLQAHCHRGLGTLYRQMGRVEQAHVALSTAIEMYQDMGMTFWVPETAAALAEVETW